MDPRTAVLVVVDVQNGFVNEHSRDVVPAVVRLVKAWQEAGCPVVFARFRNEAGSPYETITGWTRLRSDMERALVSELSPYTDAAAAIVEKTTSSFLTTEAEQLIRASGWTDLVFCGIDTDSCVYDSAVAAYQGGYRPWLVTDACASTGGAEYHDAALLLARRNIGAKQLVTTTDVLAWINNAREVIA